jgi:hypothetical protein
MEQAAWVRARLAEARKKARSTIELSPLAQERQQALEEYPHLKEAVRITNSGIWVQTNAGELSFWFEHREWGVKHADANAQYTKEQLEALVELFWKEKAPYMKILGLKDTHKDCEKEYDYNIYWSSSVHQDNVNHAWGLYLNRDGVNVDLGHRNGGFSAFSPEK